MRKSSTSSNSFGPRRYQSFKRRGQGSGSSSEGSNSESTRRSFNHFDPCAAGPSECYMGGGFGHIACDCATLHPPDGFASSYNGSNNPSISSYGGGDCSTTQSYDSSSNT